MSDWLPKDYSEPTNSNYMKFADGENIFRILSKPIMGYEYWKTVGDTRKPIRKRFDENIEVSELEADPRTGKPEVPKVFWAMVVYNHELQKIQILEITQATIRRYIADMDNSKLSGDPTGYDISVTRSGEGKETRYTMQRGDKEPIDKKIVEEYKAMNINLDALFDGEDPFAGSLVETTEGPKDEKKVYKEVFGGDEEQ